MKRWYILRVISGREESVKQTIEKKIYKQMYFKSFGKILIPSEEFVEIKFGRKEKSFKKIFPGYILIEMLMSYKNWFLIKHIREVINFVGGSFGIPIPVSNKEMQVLMEKIKKSKPKHKKDFSVGEVIRVINGPFSDFNGTVEELNYIKNKLCVAVSIFGRSTPIDLNFNQVEKI